MGRQETFREGRKTTGEWELQTASRTAAWYWPLWNPGDEFQPRAGPSLSLRGSVETTKRRATGWGSPSCRQMVHTTSQEGGFKVDIDFMENHIFEVDDVRLECN